MSEESDNCFLVKINFYNYNMKLIVFLLIAFNTNQIIAQDKKRKKNHDVEKSLNIDKITFEEAAIKMLELQNFEENIFNPLSIKYLNFLVRI